MVKSILNYKIEILILAGFLLIPVIYSRWTYDPALFPKTLALQFLLLIGLPIVWLKSRLWMGETLSHELPMLYLISLLFGLFSLAWATNPIVGFYGFVRHLSVALFYVFVLFSLRHLTDDFLMKTLVVSGLILATIGLLQCLGWKWLTSLPGATRPPYAMMANKNYYASVMLVLFCFTSVSVLLLKKGWWYLGVVSGAANLTAILLTGTRAAWVGLALGLAVTGMMASVLVMKQRLSIAINARKAVWSSVLGVVVLAVVVYGTNAYLSATYMPIGARMRSIFTFDDVRLDFWQDTLRLVKDTPVAGVGLGNFGIEFPQYNRYPLTYPAYRPHNDFLWILSETGMTGFLIYFLLVGIHFKYLTDALFSKGISRHRLIFLLGVCFATTAYLVNSLFTFPRERIYVSMLFSMCLALSTHTAIQTQKGRRYLRQLPHLFTNRAIPVVTYVLLMMVFVITIQRTYADGYGKRPYYYWELPRPPWNKVIDVSTRAIDRWAVADAHNNPVHWYRGYVHLRRGEIQPARTDLEKAYRYHPNHHGVLNFLAATYQQEGRFDEAIALYRRAVAIAPGFTQAKQNLKALQKEIATRYDPEKLNTDGIGISFIGPIEKGTISIRGEGGGALGWTAEWREKSVQLMLGSGRALDYGTTYLITIRTKDGAGNLLNRRMTLVTKVGLTQKK